MGYLRVFEYVALLVLAYVIVSQVMVPALRGTKLFPWFRREGELMEKIIETNTKVREKQLTKLLNKLRKTKERK